MRSCLLLLSLLVVALGSDVRAAAGAGSADPRWVCWAPGLADPCRNRLNGVAVVPGSGGRDVWAVGDRGTILHWDGGVWTKTPTDSTEHLLSVAMASASLGWAVGTEGSIVQWDGSTWKSLPPKVADWYRVVDIVPGSSPVNAWAAGDRSGVGFFVYYDGTAWQQKMGNKYHPFGGALYDVSMLSATDGWAVGSKFGGMGSVGQIVHWNGEHWESFAVPADELHGVDMLGPADGWSVGEGGAAYRWNGTAWSRNSTPRTEWLLDVAMVTASQGWAVGEGGAILRWDGSTWTDYSMAGISQELRSVAMASASDGWAVGDGGVILHWNGAAWQTVVAPSHTRLESVSLTPGSNGSDGWAVGGGRQMLHWQGSVWSGVNGPVSSYYAVSMASRRDGWATGPGGRFYRFDGAAWTEAVRGKSALDLVMLSASDGWAVGWGTLQHWDGAAWTEASSPTTRTLYGVDALSSSDIWAAGDVGTILHYDGHAWQSVSAPDTSWLTDVSMASAQLGYIVGNYGLVLDWNGTSWSKVAGNPALGTVRGVAVTRGTGQPTGWAVGDGGLLLRLQDGAWQESWSATGNDLFDVAIVSATEAWAVGEHGVILRYSDAPYPPPVTPTATATASPTQTAQPTPTATPCRARLYTPLLLKR